MNKICEELYDLICPKFLKKLYREKRLGVVDYRQIPYKEEYKSEYEYIKTHKVTGMFPYEWVDEYVFDICKVYSEDENQNYSLILDDKNEIHKLFWKKNTLGRENGKYLNSLIVEQDKRSPHHYFSNNVFLTDDTILFDLGAAEGYISLKYITTIKKAYLFECDKEWCDSLRRTFLDYSDKVEIINKLVSDKNDEENTTLDYYLEKHVADRVCIKMDIEGYEKVVVQNILDRVCDYKNICFCCCTYHNKEDAKILEGLFEEHGYKVEFSDGWMVLGEPREFRKGMIRAWKE